VGHQLKSELSVYALEEQKIFRSVRAVIVYDKKSVNPKVLFSLENVYSPINVQMVPAERLDIELLNGRDYDVIGVLGQSALDTCRSSLLELSCLKIGFYPERTAPARGSLKYLTAAVTCLGGTTPAELLRSTVFHFYESLTLPSLFNIDLADVRSIARGSGLSFNVSGDTSEGVISRLPPQCFVAQSALLHFTCEKTVTLDEVYTISKRISARKNPGPFKVAGDTDKAKLYKRIRLKMGLRVSREEDIPRISLTGILFGTQGLLFR
jgi:hypothetical protein